MVDMFHKFGINVDRNMLEEMYRVVDGNYDGALNFTEFKECAFSEEANKIFS
jgi:Ca2+-binding EF-hand superfamily protein